MAEHKCLRCGILKGLLSPNYAGGSFPGNPEVDYLCLNCREAIKVERTKCIGCGAVKGFLSVNYAGGVPVDIPEGRFPGNPEIEYFCEACAGALNRKGREQSEELSKQQSMAKQKKRFETIKEFAANNANRVLRITLASGACHEISHVMLYHEPSVKRAQVLQTEARKNLGGVSTGLGFWGSPGWVLGGALVLGLLESAASGLAAEQGVRQLRELEELTHEIRDSGCFIPVGSISKIDCPIPSLWVAEASVSAGFVKGIEQVSANVEKELTSEADIEPVWFIHNGEPFIRVKNSQGKAFFLAWDRVEQYSFQ